mmetsp:Transcript_16167/g.46431  ORF Transcript_16167/g.46431 Transcript_16167/m.46431 type:complete len:441 (-) Transcript_16167:41-1363(-)
MGRRGRKSVYDTMIARNYLSLLVALLACSPCDGRLPSLVRFRQLQNETEPEVLTTAPSTAPAASAPEDTNAIHPSCARGNPQDLKERPLLVLKYSRTGSTWLAWTGNTMDLASGKAMTWVHEAQGCGGQIDAEEMTTWFEEYYGKETDGKVVTAANFNKNNDGPHALPSKCLETVKAENLDDIGVLVATLNPHASHHGTPSLSDKQWERIFAAAPDLAVGVLVRTNAVKRATSAIASEFQRKICGSMKLEGSENCIGMLPSQIDVEPRSFLGKIWESEMKRSIVSEKAAQLSAKYGDGRVFCLSYEAMEMDLAGEMRDLGVFLGSPVDEESLEKLKENASSATYKRGSDDLSEYISNYDEIYDLIMDSNSPWDNKCLIEQLTTDEPKNHAFCGVYDTNSKCTEGYDHCRGANNGEEVAEVIEDLVVEEVEAEAALEESHE